MRRLAPLLLLLPWLAGCAGVTLHPHAMDRAVRVEEMGLAFAPDGSGALTLRLEVENPTLWDGEVTGVDFELRLNGRRYAVGTRGVSGVPLASDERRTLTVSFPLQSEPSEDAAARTWRVEVGGGVALAFGETVRLLPFRAERSLRLPHFRIGPPPRE